MSSKKGKKKKPSVRKPRLGPAGKGKYYTQCHDDDKYNRRKKHKNRNKEE